MKIQFIVLGSMLFIASCNTKPQGDYSNANSTGNATDTTGLAAFQAMKAQNELGIQEDEAQNEENTSSNDAKKSTTNTSSTSRTSSSSNSSEKTSASGTSSQGSSAGTGSTGTSSDKKGWSKTAKGAVIGGVAGAAGGAIINKKNRAAGAVIGGVIGAGAGAVIGNDMDKKDGRH